MTIFLAVIFSIVPTFGQMLVNPYIVTTESGGAAYTRDGLVGEWLFDEGTGTTAEDTAGANDGTLNGSTSWVAEGSGYALSFDGDGDYVSLADIPFGGTQPITIFARVKRTSTTGEQTIVSQQNEIVLRINSNSPEFILNGFTGTSDRISAAASTLSAGTWGTIAGVYDGTQMKLYEDGILVASGTPTGSYANDAGVFEIGIRVSGTGEFPGLMDAVLIYNQGLDATEIQTLHDFFN